jgi:hypothetical protein
MGNASRGGCIKLRIGAEAIISVHQDIERRKVTFVLLIITYIVVE